VGKKKLLATPEEIRRARARGGLSQLAAADWCGVDETTVQRWEAGITKKIRRGFLDRLLEHPAKK